MRILVFSDTHGSTAGCVRVIESLGTENIDALIHAGDYTSDVRDLRYAYEDKFPIYNVRGNNDFDKTPNELFINLGGKKFFIAHGHQYNVKWEDSYETFAEHAYDKGADIAIFGHTHVPYNSYYRTMNILNPGSTRFGRTYAIVEIENGRISSDIIEL